MSRRAILIEASSSKYGDLPGARRDVDNFSTFLQSNYGGAWNTEEIKILRNPSREELDRALLNARGSDYVFISYSGHGEHKVGMGVDDTFLSINDNEEVAVYKVNPANDRFLFVVDTCRHVTQITEGMREFAAKAFDFSDYDRPRYRRLFDMAVSNCEKGGIVMYSTNLEESANENAKGGYFSRYLVECGNEWGRAGNGGIEQVFDSREAFHCSEVKVTNRYPQQHPQYEPGRRLHHFPFAVSL